MGIVNNALSGASGQSSGYNLTNSLRFRSSASAYLNRTLGSSGSLRAWTWSAWVKRGTLGVQQDLFGWVDLSGGNFQQVIGFNSDNTLEFQMYNSALGGYVNRKTTSQVFRDPSAWYHIVVVWDSNNATANDRAIIYINGSRVTAWANNTNPSLNQDSYINNSSYPLGIARCMPSSSNYFDGYLTEINFVNAQALTPSSFGETSATTGVWIPKKYTGTYGTNGFYLPFTDNSALTTSSNVGLGKDFSGNANYWTTNNISITAGTTYDSMTDVPTLTSATAANYCVLNSLNQNTAITLSAGNLSFTASNNRFTTGTFAVTSGKWYWEFYPVAGGASGVGVGAILATTYVFGTAGFANGAGYTGVGYTSNGSKYVSGTSSAYGATYGSGNVIGVALDLDSGTKTITFYKDNTSQGSINLPTSSESWIVATDYSEAGTHSINFGQRPFTYTPPSGFVALNTFNLPTPTIGATASTQAINYMGATTYSGDSTSNRVITTGGGSDFVWIKRRNSSTNNILFDVLRGAGATLYSNLTNAEAANGSYYVQTFGNTSFTLGTGGDAADNITGGTYVAWNWKANGAGVTNTAGTITSTVSANTTAGFSIVTYNTGSAGNQTVGHGLGVTPAMIIIKSRVSGTAHWDVWHKSFANPAQGYMYLNLTNAVANDARNWANTAPTSTVFSYESGYEFAANANYVAYCFAPVAGYSAFGSYTGNGSSDGPFIFTGFRPRWVLIKVSSGGTGSWILYDTARNTYNVSQNILYPNLSNAEATTTSANLDILSNGFKLRTSNADFNGSGFTYIYMAFAENPFKYSNAR